MLDGKWILTEKDIINAENLYQQEQILDINKETMFLAGIYCILSVSENYRKQKSIYDMLLENDLDSPEQFIKDKKTVDEILKTARFPNRKSKYVYNFSLLWPKSGFYELFMEDIDNGRQDEFKLRNKFADKAPGIGHKSASLFMAKCGYENVVPLDLWMIRFLKDHGVDVEVPDYKKQSGPKSKEYLFLEEQFIDIANKQGFSPVFFQFALWGKATGVDGED